MGRGAPRVVLVPVEARGVGREVQQMVLLGRLGRLGRPGHLVRAALVLRVVHPVGYDLSDFAKIRF